MTSLSESISVLSGRDSWHTPAAVGIPEIRMSDGPAGARGTSWTGPRSAVFPCGSALGATFDPRLIQEVGVALGNQARSNLMRVGFHRGYLTDGKSRTVITSSNLGVQLATSSRSGVSPFDDACVRTRTALISAANNVIAA